MNCSEQGCDKPSQVRGVCKSHYGKLRLREDPDYYQRNSYKCQKCRAWTTRLDLCVSCKVLRDAIKQDKWKVTKLEHSTYYRRVVGNLIVRIYDGPSVHWEMDGDLKFREGKAKRVVDVMRRVRENERKMKTRETRKKAGLDIY